MVSKQSHRKDEHVSLAEHLYGGNHSDFSAVRLVPTSLPHINIEDVDLTTSVSELEFKLPFFINAITGGSERSLDINCRLAKIASNTGLAMAVGSQSIAISNPDQIPSFSVVRETNPNGIIFANIGANHGPEAAMKAIDMIQADALQVHVNAAQELVMPEGDRKFNFIDNIKAILKAVSVPVIVKEVGFGMSQQTITELAQLGVKVVDISGMGGTNFAKIENFRRPGKSMDYLADWGLTTVESLMEAAPINLDVDVIASGGIKTPLDMAKCFSLGAKLVGMSGELLHLLLTNSDDEAIIERINDWVYGLKTIMVLTNSKKITDLTKVDQILSPPLAAFKKQRGSGLF